MATNAATAMRTAAGSTVERTGTGRRIILLLAAPLVFYAAPRLASEVLSKARCAFSGFLEDPITMAPWGAGANAAQDVSPMGGLEPVRSHPPVGPKSDRGRPSALLPALPPEPSMEWVHLKNWPEFDLVQSAANPRTIRLWVVGRTDGHGSVHSTPISLTIRSVSPRSSISKNRARSTRRFGW